MLRRKASVSAVSCPARLCRLAANVSTARLTSLIAVTSVDQLVCSHVPTAAEGASVPWQHREEHGTAVGAGSRRKEGLKVSKWQGRSFGS